MNRPIFGAMGLSIVALSLAACRPAHAEWQNECVASHQESSIMPMTTIDSQGNPQVTLVPSSDTVCDQTARVCVAGRDGSTDCGIDPAADAADVSGVIGQM